MVRIRFFTLLLLTLTLISCGTVRDHFLERQMEKGLSRIDFEMFNDGNLRVVMVGTGGPMYNTERLPSCTAVIAGGEMIVVDIGAGTVRNADLQNLPLKNITALFLTHFHSDHISDLGELNFFSQAMGRDKALDVYGPEGVQDVVDGYSLAFKHDTSYRIAHHGEAIFSTQVSVPVAREVRLKDPDAAELFFDRNGLKAYAFRVDHAPANPSYGYRFEYKGNVVVISADTKKIDNLTRHAKDADIFICEGLRMDVIERLSAYAGKTQRPRFKKITKDILDYHIDPVDAGRVAQEANVGKLVFNHVVPPVTSFLARRMFLDGVDDVFDGEIVLGEDGMRFTLEPKD